MYAITSNSWRAIASADDAHAGETVVDALPQSLLDSVASAEAQRNTTTATIREQAESALAGLRAYRDKASPTNADSVAALKLVCRVWIALIRLQLAKLDATD